MKKPIVFICFLFLITLTAHACEICGCGVGNVYIGQLPGFKTKFIGIRYQYMGYRSEMAVDKSQFSKDNYQTTEIWSGWNLGRQWQLLTFVPWRFNQKISDDGVKKNSGLGDITVLANYRLLHRAQTNRQNEVVEQQVWLGAGLKLATGKYHVYLTDPNTNIGDANSQNGTGSIGYLLNGVYQLRIGSNGFGSSVHYQYNTTNTEGYLFGNRISITGFVYHRYRIAGNVISPNLGLLYERSNSNQLHGEVLEQTGGHHLNLTGGVEVSLNKLSLGVNTQLPLQQQYASGQTLLTNHTVVHLSIAL